MRKYTIVNTKNIFIISIMVISLTVLSIWLFGLGTHRTIIENSLLSTTILSIAFLLFISIGLYKGVKLKDNLGKITDRFDSKKIDKLKEVTLDSSSDVPDVGDGIAGIIMSIIFWFIAAFVISYLFWFFGAILWITVLIFIAMLYWIFFRALRLVFKKSAECKGNYSKSLLYGFSYTVLYNFWIYGIILLIQYFGK
ncbi:hypothetical protein LZZ90_13795 [Flavobacterium sp. SM15]|uniref:Uncharacterized protein n=2 Tax=Flavobacterium saliperosum TaxID=329186 RepID=A0A1G4W9T7_9FLAO|nr:MULTISPECIES: hypothetical protein [Flavobacterium]ESU25276.1 hypothetical protein FSS13T_18520 [Flavobacterium saliperosum S13]MCG2612583.1 hypothetical protein [Flavobacterium sp. SM15]SCX19126.1 hypothetical protein SAMN02927925_02772 [Flavobacterium saliperosum]